MRVTVKFFAILRDRAGISERILELPEGSTAEAATRLLLEIYPKLGEHLPKSALAVNRAYGPRDTVLHDEDELALIPPVSGG